MANQNLARRTYQLEFKNMIEAVYRTQAHYGDFFGGGILTVDGVENNENAFYVKTSDIPVVVGEYDTGANVAFGTGTGNSTRFGERTEIIYENTPVPYTTEWSIHEGIDRFTVNNNFQAAIADRLELQAQAKVRKINKDNATFISESAGETLELDANTPEAVADLFNELANYFTNKEVVGNLVAKVTPEVYNIIVDHPSTTTAKHSSANIDNNTIVSFKGFDIDKLPNSQFEEGEVVYAYVGGVGRVFTGINTVRTFESEDFDGVALQGAGRGGQYIPEDNKAAVVKVTGTP